MCFVCQHPNHDNYAGANPAIVLKVKGEARLQRQNLESMKARGPECPLCPKHLANYEAVVEALEEYERRARTLHR